MSDMKKRILDLIAKKGALDPKKYESDSTYRQIYDVLADAIEKQWSGISDSLRKEEWFESFVVLALTSWSDVGKELSITQAMKDAESAYMARYGVQTLSRTTDWSEAQQLHRQVGAALKSIESKRLRAIVEPWKKLTRGRTPALIAGYTFALAVVMPLAAGIVAGLWDELRDQSALGSEIRNGIGLLLALMVAYPLDLVNRRIKTARVPRIHPFSAPLLLVVTAAAFVEYQYTLIALLGWADGPSWLDWTVFWSLMSRAATESWLFLAPFVAITLTLLNRSGFIRPPEEVVDTLSDLGEAFPIMPIIIGLISAILAALLRGIVVLVT